MGFSIFAMPSSSLYLLLSVAFGAGNALPWSGAQQTDVYQPANWSPKPTSVPANPARLFKRKTAKVNICGWVGGISSEPAVCSSGSSCIHDTLHGYVGCCATSGPCTEGVYTTCLDQNSADWTASPGIINNGIYTWCVGALNWNQHILIYLALPRNSVIEIPTQEDISSTGVVRQIGRDKSQQHILDRRQICYSS